MQKLRKRIDVLAQALEPGTQYAIFLDKRYVTMEDVHVLASKLPEGSLVVVGHGDPAQMVKAEEARDYGYVTIFTTDHAHTLAWRLPDTSKRLKDLDVDAWEAEMVARFREKVHEVAQSLKRKQGERNS